VLTTVSLLTSTATRCLLQYPPQLHRRSRTKKRPKRQVPARASSRGIYIFMSVFLSIYLSIYLFMYLFLFLSYIYISIYISISICIYIHTVPPELYRRSKMKKRPKRLVPARASSRGARTRMTFSRAGCASPCLDWATQTCCWTGRQPARRIVIRYH